MKEWFTPGSDYPFYSFGTSHIIVLVIFFIILIAIPLFSSRLNKYKRTFQTVRFSLLILLIWSEVSYQTWTAVNGLWNFADHMPLHLCGIASLLGMVSLITYKPKLIKINFFIGIIPALIALITPDLPYDYHHYRFWKFFLHHMAIPWTSLFLVVTARVEITWKDMIETYAYLVGYAVIIGLINFWTGANYLYLDHPPGAGTLLGVIGDGIAYILNLSLLALFTFLVMLGFYKLSRRFLTRKEE
ncbi:TIGR02206 family membrane protein [Halobacillus sp. BBL2006]|uniref:YwaF family protein n=1 Tax=Halobacillus sp. BBL2006 TaxID=1543706 RepID=UPI0005435C3A|nr:TIGR02206 family membrane protein [Halobacillus sp. BBL2006]KHE72083.1 hypothetical protein LD39_06415 [Halobacillus sp. BBL2006]